MKILVTHELFPPEVTRMGERIMYEIAKRLQKERFEIKVLTTGNPKIKRYDRIETIRLPIHRYLMNLAILSVYKHAKDCDLILTSNYNACFPSFVAAKLLKKPVVCLAQGMYGKRWLLMRGHIFGSISMIVEEFQINHDYDKIIFFSKYGRDAALEIGVKKESTQIIKPGFDNKKFYAGKKEPYVLFVGRLAKQKGLDYLIKAAKELPNIQFKIVGGGEDEKRLKSIAPNNIEFLGFLPEKELTEIYSKALIFCLPSVGETLGFVLLEAMASGCAIVSTVPLDYDGIKVKIADLKQLKGGIRYLIDNPKKAIKMGRNNMKKVKQYNWNNFIKGLIKIYREVLSSR